MSRWPKKSDMTNVNNLYRPVRRFPGQLQPGEAEENERLEQERRQRLADLHPPTFISPPKSNPRAPREAKMAAATPAHHHQTMRENVPPRPRSLFPHEKALASKAAAEDPPAEVTVTSQTTTSLTPDEPAMASSVSVFSNETRDGGVPLRPTFGSQAAKFQPSVHSEPTEDGAATMPVAPASVTSASNIPTTPNKIVSKPLDSMALVIHSQDMLMGLLSHDMYTDTVRLDVSGRDGQAPKTFSVHRNLLHSLGGRFPQELAASGGDVYELPNTSTSAVLMLIQYAYKGVILQAQSSLSATENLALATVLCQFYGLCEGFKLRNNLLNQILDAIQDAFFKLELLPEAALARALYDHTSPGSMLRKFLAAGVLAHHRHLSLSRDFNLQSLLKDNEDFIADFLEAVKVYEPGSLPTARVVTDEMYQAGYAGPAMPALPPRMKGVRLCEFHIHSPVRPSGSDEEDTVGENDLIDSLLETCHFFA